MLKKFSKQIFQPNSAPVHKFLENFKMISLHSECPNVSSKPSTTFLSSSKPKLELEQFSYFQTINDFRIFRPLMPKYGNPDYSAPVPQFSKNSKFIISLHSACPYASNEPSTTFLSLSKLLSVCLSVILSVLLHLSGSTT